MSLHVLEGYDATQPVVDRVFYLLNGLVRYSIQHPREFLLTNQLAQIPFIHERAKSELKALMPEDAREAIGHGVKAKRSKSGAISFDVLETEPIHAPVQ